MSNLETGKDKIKKICEILKAETLDPAKEEALHIIEQARQEANEIIKLAEKKSQEIIHNGRLTIEKEKAVFKTSLAQASKQGIEALKQEVEENLFKKELGAWIDQELADSHVIGKVLTALIDALEKEGLEANFSAVLPKTASQEEIFKAIGKRVQEKLQKGQVTIGDFFGGAQVNWRERSITLDMSSEAIKELLGKYIGKTFRQYLFD